MAMRRDHGVEDFDFLFHSEASYQLLITKKSESELTRAEMILAAQGLGMEQVYEGCMFASEVATKPAGNGLFAIRFPEGLGLDRLPIHRHKSSARKVLVLSGAGRFYFFHPLEGRYFSVEVCRGNLVGFVRGLRHTFITERSEMRVLALHEPFQELDDPGIIDFVTADDGLPVAIDATIQLPYFIPAP